MKTIILILFPIILFSQAEDFHIKLIPTNDTSRYNAIAGTYYAVYTCDNWKTLDTLKGVTYNLNTKQPGLYNKRFKDTGNTYEYLVNLNCKKAKNVFKILEEEKIKAKHKIKGEIYIK